MPLCIRPPVRLANLAPIGQIPVAYRHGDDYFGITHAHRRI
jgi:hypothetical protein